jgi:hypothetical protein
MLLDADALSATASDYTERPTDGAVGVGDRSSVCYTSRLF